jgi:hypothetical protein
MAALRQLIYRQVELVEKSKLQSHDAERVQNPTCDDEQPDGGLSNASSQNKPGG